METAKNSTWANDIHKEIIAHMRKLLEIIFVLMFVLTGCSVDSIFEGGALEWFVCFGILILIAWALFGGRE